MHLRAITLAGFKTFARQTEIRFEDGVTAIVGPNGSGKTNIVDAFKWVLGESQARDLRGKRMDEVIYAGGERRARSSAAEVTIVIDNSDGRLPVDYSEVAIRRRLDRGGQSDYFMNGARVRRRDLIDILASTGLTTDSYALVDQRDIEAIISAAPEQRRGLIEEAAQVRGVKAKRSDAALKLEELAGNLLRLEDLRREIEPRLEGLRLQAQAAREAWAAQSRLEMLRGSLLWEEWREARDAGRRAQTQLQSLQRRLVEARTQSEIAETDFRRGRLELEAAQDRRLQRQRRLGELNLAASQAEHDLAMARERAQNQAALAEAALAEAADLSARLAAAGALRAQLGEELAGAQAQLEALPAPPEPPPAPPAGDAAQARQQAERLRRDLAVAQSELATVRTRREFLGESLERLLDQVREAQAELPRAGEEHSRLQAAASAAAQAAGSLARFQAELEGLAALRPEPVATLRVRDVLSAHPGYEVALAAVLGPLAGAWVAEGPDAAGAMLDGIAQQITVLYPNGAPPPTPGSLWEHVECRPGFEAVGHRLLGRVHVGHQVSLDGVYREPGMLRGGPDAEALLEARRRLLIEEVDRLRPLAGAAATSAALARQADARLQELRLAASAARRVDDSRRQLDRAREEEGTLAQKLTLLEEQRAAAQHEAERLSLAAEVRDRVLAEHRAEVRRLELEALRWRDRAGDLSRQVASVERDLAGLADAQASRARRAASAAAEADATSAGVPALEAAAHAARNRLEEASAESPSEEAELAAGARKLVALEEARVDARLRVSTLEGSQGLIVREAELAQARLEEIRGRLPEGLAPEEVPGGRAREREMRALERRLEEIGPTNPLAESEYAELDERHGTLAAQLEDVAAARRDLESLVERLRSEEESRYEAVFGAVAANFQEYLAELTRGGRGTLRHTSGEDGPRSGVEILVQPPRKRLQNVTLLSSGERSLTALALVLALEAVNPAPFTILDEVDAALDDANVGRFGEMLGRLGRERQFLVITHNHLTMACAGALYGVHLDESGSSHLVSVRLDDIRPARRRPADTATA